VNRLTFYYDVACPYAYLGSTQAMAVADAAGAELVWRPILLGGLYKMLEAPQQPALSMPPAKARLNSLDLLRQADLLGAVVRWHPRHPVRTVEAMRLLVAADDGVRPALTAALYQTYWVDHGDVSDRATLARLGAKFGVDVARIDDPAVKEGLKKNTDEAFALGGFGVPIWRVQRSDGFDRMWWGTDRLHLVAQALGVERAFPEPFPKAEVGLPITFYHDFASPFSYLASTQIQALADQEGANVTWVPFLLGALFKEIGTPVVPILAANRHKAAYYARDMVDQARWLGVPFRMPSHFPLRTVTPLRVALQEPAATPHIYRAAWVEDRDIGNEAVLRGVLDEAGLNGASLIAGAQDPAVKLALVANTERARTQGLCGVPTCEVGGRIYWGVDRLEQVRQAVRGWRAAAG
jgi:2-hydroxychromene-2-carboxylate isomerase